MCVIILFFVLCRLSSFVILTGRLPFSSLSGVARFFGRFVDTPREGDPGQAGKEGDKKLPNSRVRACASQIAIALSCNFAVQKIRCSA